MEKDFLGFKQGYDIDVLIDNIQIQNDYFYFDISNPDENIIGIKILHEELMKIKNKINDKNDGKVTTIEILSGKKLISMSLI